MENIEHLRYPVGTFARKENYSANELKSNIETINLLPELFIAVARSLTKEQLYKTYRPQGWNALQVIHHLADSHANAFIRFKLTLTETNPTIKPYFESLWAELPDGKSENINPSLAQLKEIHNRWHLLMSCMGAEDWSRTYFHPEHQKEWSLDAACALYAWHCNHHLGHLKIISKL